MAHDAPLRHGVVCRRPGEAFNYFGWPTGARLEDGTILVGSSGGRKYHVDPWGKSVLSISRDGGATFGPPQVVNDSLIDDRDVGLLALGGRRALMSWFSLDTRRFYDRLPGSLSAADWARAKAEMDAWPDARVRALSGSWARLSDDAGATWSAPIRVPVSAPHGPIRLKSGRLAYLGKEFLTDAPDGNVALAISDDGGHTWRMAGAVPLPEGRKTDQFHEPHLIELKDGTLWAAIRYHKGEAEGGGLGLYRTESRDGGASWTVARPMDITGSPPHLLRHSSGAMVMTYGYRLPGYGQRARISTDEGATWGEERILRSDGINGDLGYPSSIELADGAIMTVYYQAYPGDAVTSILYTCWRI